ncbi:sugar kinase [Dickeya undicola]|uniref:Sugar kinase n=1 Tax=Dickeya undicola TaxID=1577887 RepID=A0A3N0FRZ9_9GAMM|nr:sugar kinase [Dickeya undicola]RNM02867.1 sugar kinase [Dickeya undicola]
MAMESPEILLEELNNALRRLRGASTVLGAEDIEEKLLEVMRSLLLAEVLANTWIVAMGGSQGAGKTTLMASMYDLCGENPRWLQSNEGRGEKMPVLILEDEEIDKPQGYVRRLVANEAFRGFKLGEEEVDVNEFQKAICDPNANDLLPVLKVPCRYFKRNNQAWLLLPGYEKQDRANRVWQELMRQAMIAAGGCIIVTDETRMANQQQLDIVRDMLENELRNCKPYIVISKTEAHRHNPQRQAELRASAQTTFQVDVERTEQNIILSGTDDPEYVQEWMLHLRRAIDDLNFAGQADRYLQISHLSEILGKDLTRVLNAIRSKSRLYFNSDRGGMEDGFQVLEEVLEEFDIAAERLRAQHSDLVKKCADTAHTKALKKLDERLKKQEGFAHWISTALDTTSETKVKMQELVQGVWQEVAPGFHAGYAHELSILTQKELGRQPESNTDGGLIADLPAQQQKMVELGYLHQSGQLVQFSKLNKDAVSDITILLGNWHEELLSQDVSKQLKKSVALIPAISLEYTRLIYATPEIYSDLKQCFTDGGEPVNGNIALEGVESLKAGVDLGKTAIRSLATVMAVDVVSDGDSDILGAIFGKMPSVPADDTSGMQLPVPMMLHPVAVAATAVVAAAYVTTAAVTRIRTFEKKASMQAHNMLCSVNEHHIEHLRKQFNETMRVARERLVERVRARYRMDETLMRKDRLVKAIADVNSITSDLRYELDSSAAGLQLFLSERNV